LEGGHVTDILTLYELHFFKTLAEGGEARDHALEEEVSFPHIRATTSQSSVISCKSIANMWRKLIECVMKNMGRHLKYICRCVSWYHQKVSFKN
jgi:hypothetical protein